MMRTACVCFTDRGAATAERIRAVLGKYETNRFTLFTKRRETASADGLFYIDDSLKEWTRQRFLDSDAILFVGACGIAVRSIAPFLVSKAEDPAVLVIDETGSWVISLVSGHLGGANALAREIAAGISAQPVITTATDLNERFAVDVFARENKLFIGSMELAREISAAVLAGRPVGLRCAEEFVPEGMIPPELSPLEKNALPYKADEMLERPILGINISLNERARYFEKTLALVPCCTVLGVGCRKGKTPEELETFLLQVLDASDVSVHSVKKICSIDLKENEEAVVLFAEKYRLPYETYTVQQLTRVPGHFSASTFVESMVGVDNVCERSAVLGAMTENEPGKLILPKIAQNGMTAALAAEKVRLCF